MNTPTTSTLHVRWDDGALAASADHAPVIIGRGLDAAVQLSDRSVSRAHVRVHADDGNWVAVDESSRGTFDSGGGRVERLNIGDAETTLHLGSPDGPTVRLIAVTPPTPEPGPPQPQAPYIPPIDPGEAWTVATSDTTLRLEVDGEKHAFPPPGRVVVGRDQGCDVVCDDDLVSRQHLSFTSTSPNGPWTMEDLGSSRGTFVDGKRLTKPTPAQGAFVAVLGDEDAGERVQVVTAGVHRRPRDRSKLLLVLGVVVAVLASAGIAYALRDTGGDDDVNSPEQIASAKSSTVFIIALSIDGGGGFGSGTFVSDDLILTNAHVADLSPGPDGGFLIATSGGEDQPVQLSTAAVDVARHPYLDLALLRVDEELQDELEPVLAEGELSFGPFESMPMPLGDSTDLIVGSEVASLGFPAISSVLEIDLLEGLLPVATVADGRITGLLRWPGCESGDEVLDEGGDCSTDGDLPRGSFLSDDFSGSGGSGGPVIVAGELVAVRYAVFDPSRLPEEFAVTGGLAASMPIEYFADWLADEISGL